MSVRLAMEQVKDRRVVVIKRPEDEYKEAVLMCAIGLCLWAALYFWYEWYTRGPK